MLSVEVHACISTLCVLLHVSVWGAHMCKYVVDMLPIAYIYVGVHTHV